MRNFMMLSFLILSIGCQNPGEPESVTYGEEFELNLGESVIIGEKGESFEFVDVLEDSRCPSNVTCVWAGNGKVQLRFENHHLQLNTYIEPHDTTVPDVVVQLLSLAPYPETPRQFEKDDYKVRLLITNR